MARKPGRLVKVAYSTNLATPEWVEIVGIVDATLNLEQSEIENTTHDDGDWSSFMPSRKAGTIDVTMRYYDDDVSQDGLRASYFAGTILRFRFRMDAAVGSQDYVANGFITSLSPAGPNDDPAGFDLSIRIAGGVTMTDIVTP
jgi:predicted secreted protein